MEPASNSLLYCIGAQKAATSWLFSQLAAHPQVAVPPIKEVHYWNSVRGPLEKQLKPLNRLGTRHHGKSGGSMTRLAQQKSAYAKLLDDRFHPRAYLEFLAAGAGDAKVLCDFTPAYALLSSQTYGEMFQLHPEARFVFIMREPAERFVSGLRQMTRAWLTGSQATLTELSLLANDALGIQAHHPAFLKSDYAGTITRLEKAVPADRILYLFYEGLFTPDSMKKIADFLDISPLDAQFASIVNESVQPDLGLEPGVFAKVRAALTPVYEFVNEKFGDATPLSWGNVAERRVAS